MLLSDVSVRRPVLATVLSLLIVLFGSAGLVLLPNRELPDVDPPVVSVTTVLPGAAAEVVETSVTQPLEDELIGIEGIRHITSTSREQSSQISIEFELSRDVEDGANDVRDRVARARRRLQLALEGMSVDADMAALESVREHIGRLAAEGQIDRELGDEGMRQRLRSFRDEARHDAARAELEQLKGELANSVIPAQSREVVPVTAG